MNAIRFCPSGSVRTGRSSQLSPRSLDRKSRVRSTKAHTTFLEGALSCAKLGSVIGVADTVSDGDTVGVGAWAGLADGGVVVALDTGGGAAQAAISSTAAIGAQRSQSVNPVCAGLFLSTSATGRKTRTVHLVVASWRTNDLLSAQMLAEPAHI